VGETTSQCGLALTFESERDVRVATSAPRRVGSRPAKDRLSRRNRFERDALRPRKKV